MPKRGFEADMYQSRYTDNQQSKRRRTDEGLDERDEEFSRTSDDDRLSELEDRSHSDKDDEDDSDNGGVELIQSDDSSDGDDTYRPESSRRPNALTTNVSALRRANTVKTNFPASRRPNAVTTNAPAPRRNKTHQSQPRNIQTRSRTTRARQESVTEAPLPREEVPRVIGGERVAGEYFRKGYTMEDIEAALTLVQMSRGG